LNIPKPSNPTTPGIAVPAHSISKVAVAGIVALVAFVAGPVLLGVNGRV